MTENELTVSVVLPTWNAIDTLPSAVASVLAQTIPPIELLIIDDGSTDATSTWLETLPLVVGVTRIRTHQQSNQGVSMARNYGIQHATGNLIALLDSDDLWHPEKLAVQMDVFSKNPDLVLLGCSTSTLPPRVIGRLDEITIRSLLWRNWLLTPSVVVRSEILRTTGGFRKNMRHCEDYELWLRIASKYRCALLNRTLVECGQGKPSFGHSGLSGDLNALGRGEVEALNYWRKEHMPSIAIFFFARILAAVRHYRRQFIHSLRGARSTTREDVAK